MSLRRLWSWTGHSHPPGRREGRHTSGIQTGDIHPGARVGGPEAVGYIGVVPAVPFGEVVGPRSLIVGALVSMLTVSVALFRMPALSLTEQLMVWEPSPETLAVQVPAVEPAVSVREVAPSVQVGAPARPEPESLAETLSVTGEVLFQPFEPSAVWLTERVGGVVSGVV